MIDPGRGPSWKLLILICVYLCSSVANAALLLSVLACLVLAGPAHAHRLLAEYHVLPGRRVQIESWFDLTGDSPPGARIQVFRADGALLTEGKLDDKGLFVFSYTSAEPLKVVVAAGAGHSKVLHIAEADLTAAEADPGKPPPDDAPTLRADRGSQVSWRDVLTGIAFLLALAAFLLSLRTARRLREVVSGE